jgi:hypothetical protein
MQPTHYCRTTSANFLFFFSLIQATTTTSTTTTAYPFPFLLYPPIPSFTYILGETHRNMSMDHRYLSLPHPEFHVQQLHPPHAHTHALSPACSRDWKVIGAPHFGAVLCCACPALSYPRPGKLCIAGSACWRYDQYDWCTCTHGEKEKIVALVEDAK